jgi:hypothetical protein
MDSTSAANTAISTPMMAGACSVSDTRPAPDTRSHSLPISSLRKGWSGSMKSLLSPLRT